MCRGSVAKVRLAMDLHRRVLLDDMNELDPGAERRGTVRHRGQNRFRQTANLGEGLSFRPKLDQIRPAIAKLPRYQLGRATMQIGRIHKRIQAAFR